MEDCPHCGKAFKRLKTHLPHCKAAVVKGNPNVTERAKKSQKTATKTEEAKEQRLKNEAQSKEKKLREPSTPRAQNVRKILKKNPQNRPIDPDGTDPSRQVALDNPAGLDGPVLGSDRSAPGLDGPVLGSDRSAPGLDGPVPGSDRPAPGLDGPVLGSDRPAPGLDGPVLRSDRPAPGLDGPVLRSDRPAPGLDGPVLGSDRPAPGLDGPLLGSDRPAPGLDGPVLRSDRPTPGLDGPVPGSDRMAPGLDGPVLGSDRSAPGLDGPILGSDRPAPGLDGPVLRSDRPTPGLGGPVLGSDRSAPGLDGPVLVSDRSAPGLDGPVLVSDRSAPGLDGPVLGSDRPAPGLDGPVLGSDRSAPGLGGPVLGSDRSAPGLDGPVLGSDRPAPGLDGPVLGSDRMAPGLDGPVLGSDRSAPGLDGPVLGSDRMAPGLDGPVLRSDRLTPGLDGPVLGSDRLTPGLDGPVTGLDRQAPVFDGPVTGSVRQAPGWVRPPAGLNSSAPRSDRPTFVLDHPAPELGRTIPGLDKMDQPDRGSEGPAPGFHIHLSTCDLAQAPGGTRRSVDKEGSRPGYCPEDNPTSPSAMTSQEGATSSAQMGPSHVAITRSQTSDLQALESLKALTWPSQKEDFRGSTDGLDGAKSAFYKKISKFTEDGQQGRGHGNFGGGPRGSFSEKHLQEASEPSPEPRTPSFLLSSTTSSGNRLHSHLPGSPLPHMSDRIGDSDTLKGQLDLTPAIRTETCLPVRNWSSRNCSLGLQWIPELHSNYIQVKIVPPKMDLTGSEGRMEKTEPPGPADSECRKPAGPEVPLTSRRLMDVRLGELPSWLELQRLSIKRIPELGRRAWTRYYNKYINVKKSGIGGLSMLLVGYCALSYTWNYQHIRQDRWRKYH